MGFSAAAKRQILEQSRPHSLWPAAARILDRIERSLPGAIPVAVVGSTSYECESGDAMRTAVDALGRNLPKFDLVALLTGAMPGVGQDVGEAFCGYKDFSPRLWNLLPHNYDMQMPENGAVLLAGRSFVERQSILGMSASITVVVGGGPGTVREANMTLGSGGMVLPIACTGGAATGIAFEGVDEAEQKIDMGRAREVALSSGVISADH